MISNICKFLAKTQTCEQVSGVRGSPLLRTIFLAIALLATGAGLSRITGAREGPVAAGKVVEEVLAEDGWGVEIPFRLLLSAPAEEVELEESTSAVVEATEDRREEEKAWPDPC